MHSILADTPFNICAEKINICPEYAFNFGQHTLNTGNG